MIKSWGYIIVLLLVDNDIIKLLIGKIILVYC